MSRPSESTANEVTKVLYDLKKIETELKTIDNHTLTVIEKINTEKNNIQELVGIGENLQLISEQMESYKRIFKNNSSIIEQAKESLNNTTEESSMGIRLLLATVESLQESLLQQTLNITNTVKNLQKSCEQQLDLALMPTQTEEVKTETQKDYLTGLNFVEVEDDGNCFYYAIAATLNSENKGSSLIWSHSSLRDTVADFWDNIMKSQNNTMSPKLQEQKDLLTSMVVANLTEEYEKKLAETKAQLDTVPFYTFPKQQQAQKTIETQISQLEKKRDEETTVTPKKITDYIERTKTNKVFADHASIVALSERLNRPIVVMEFDTNNSNTPKIRVPIIGEGKHGEPIFVHFDEQRKHYSALIVQEGYNSRQILQKLQNTTQASSNSYYATDRTPDARSIKRRN